MSSEVRMKKSPAWAGILSFLPGLGQVYIGYYVAGFINIVVFISLIMLSDSRAARGIEGPFILLTIFFWFFNIIDAVRKANHYNNAGRVPRVPTDSPLVSGIMLLVVGGLLTLGVTFDLDLDWLVNVWPLLLVGAGLYMIYRYKATKEKLEKDRLSSLAREQSGGYPGAEPPPTPGTMPAPPAGPGGGQGPNPMPRGGQGSGQGPVGGPMPGQAQGPMPGQASGQGSGQAPIGGPMSGDISQFGNPSAADLVFGDQESAGTGPTPPLPPDRNKPEDEDPWRSN